MYKLVRIIKAVIIYELGLLEKIFYWKTKKYLSKYYSLSNKKANNQNKILIYMLDGRAYSGGISDILKGILSMYKFSKEIGFEFRINFCYPYNLSDYLKPNLYDWAISEKEISYNPNCAAYLWIYSSYFYYGKSAEDEVNFQKKILHKFISKNSSKEQFHIYTNSNWSVGSEYSLLFNELFIPAKPLKNLIDDLKKKIGAEYISMTFRFQQLLGDFIENTIPSNKTEQILESIKLEKGLTNKNAPNFAELQLRSILGDFKDPKISIPLNEEEKLNLIDRCIHKITEIHQIKYPEFTILITSDSEIFLKEIAKLNFVYIISSKEISKVINPQVNYTIFLKAFADILMLSESKKLHSLCAGSMYKSGFAKNASFINNREYEEINF